jgi:hypothetical protein
MMSRTKLISTLLFFVFSSSVNAQKFDAGFQVGLNTSQITGDDLAGYNKPGITAGIWVMRHFANPKISAWMEISYLPKGSKKNLRPSDSIPTYYRLNLNYIEVPLTLNYRITTKLSLETGLSCGVYISHSEEDEFGDLSGIYGSREQFARTDISFNAGGNWHINEKWMFNVRVANSVFPVRKHDQETSFRLNRGQYSSCVMGRLFYTF